MNTSLQSVLKLLLKKFNCLIWTVSVLNNPILLSGVKMHLSFSICQVKRQNLKLSICWWEWFARLFSRSNWPTIVSLATLCTYMPNILVWGYWFLQCMFSVGWGMAPISVQLRNAIKLGSHTKLAYCLVLVLYWTGAAYSAAVENLLCMSHFLCLYYDYQAWLHFAALRN